MSRKANWDQTLQKSLKFSDCRKSIRKQIRPSCRKNLSNSICVCLVSWKQRNLEIRANITKSCRRHGVSLLYATKSAFTAPNLYWACALASGSPVTFLTGDHVMQIGFGQISPSASSTRDLGTRLGLPYKHCNFVPLCLPVKMASKTVIRPIINRKRFYFRIINPKMHRFRIINSNVTVRCCYITWLCSQVIGLCSP